MSENRLRRLDSIPSNPSTDILAPIKPGPGISPGGPTKEQLCDINQNGITERSLRKSDSDEPMHSESYQNSNAYEVLVNIAAGAKSQLICPEISDRSAQTMNISIDFESSANCNPASTKQPPQHAATREPNCSDSKAPCNQSVQFEKKLRGDNLLVGSLPICYGASTQKNFPECQVFRENVENRGAMQMRPTSNASPRLLSKQYTSFIEGFESWIIVFGVLFSAMVLLIFGLGFIIGSMFLTKEVSNCCKYSVKNTAYFY